MDSRVHEEVYVPTDKYIENIVNLHNDWLLNYIDPALAQQYFDCFISLFQLEFLCSSFISILSLVFFSK